VSLSGLGKGPRYSGRSPAVSPSSFESSEEVKQVKQRRSVVVDPKRDGEMDRSKNLRSQSFRLRSRN